MHSCASPEPNRQSPSLSSFPRQSALLLRVNCTLGDLASCTRQSFTSRTATCRCNLLHPQSHTLSHKLQHLPLHLNGQYCCTVAVMQTPPPQHQAPQRTPVQQAPEAVHQSALTTGTPTETHPTVKSRRPHKRMDSRSHATNTQPQRA